MGSPSLMPADDGNESDDLLYDADLLVDGEKEDVEEPHNEVDEAAKEGRRLGHGRAKSDLFNEILNVPENVPDSFLYLTLEKWLEGGNDLTGEEVSLAMCNLWKPKMCKRALLFSEWLESRKEFEFIERDYATWLDLIAKQCGLHEAEAYIKTIPESCSREIMYWTLLAKCVS